MNEMIQVDALTKSYGPMLAVDRISFDVKEGEIFGFLGPNGAGKTSTIRMMVGLTQPSSGTACIAGRDVLKEPVEVKKTIGLVPESFVGKLRHGAFVSEFVNSTGIRHFDSFPLPLHFQEKDPSGILKGGENYVSGQVDVHPSGES